MWEAKPPSPCKKAQSESCWMREQRLRAPPQPNSSKDRASWPFSPPRRQQDTAQAIQSHGQEKSRNASHFYGLGNSHVFIPSSRQSRAATSHLTSGKMSPIKADNLRLHQSLWGSRNLIIPNPRLMSSFLTALLCTKLSRETRRISKR